MVHINSPAVRPCWEQAFVILLFSEPGENQAGHGGAGSLGCSAALHLSCLTGEPQQDSCRVLSVCLDQRRACLSVCVCSDDGAQGTEGMAAGPGTQLLLQHLPAAGPASPQDAPGAWMYFSSCLFLKDGSFYTLGSLQI